jgi:hypothetical protein
MADFDSSSRTLSNESVHSEESFFSDEDLTPEQIDELLLRASQRLRENQIAKTQTQTTALTLPKLKHAPLPAPYVQKTGKIARTESKSLVPDSVRSAMDSPRSIIDPVTAKQNRLKGMFIFINMYFAMMKPTDFIRLLLDAVPGLILSPLCTYESLYIIVTLSISSHPPQCTHTKISPEQPLTRIVAAKDTLSEWYNLPRTDLTPEFKRDLQLLNMRSVLDPHRMYKKPGKFRVPEYSQMGVIVEGPTEFFSGRIQKKDRKKTFVEDALATEAKTGRFKMKYGEVQMKKTSGKKAFYKALKAKRKAGGKG